MRKRIQTYASHHPICKVGTLEQGQGSTLRERRTQVSVGQRACMAVALQLARLHASEDGLYYNLELHVGEHCGTQILLGRI